MTNEEFDMNVKKITEKIKSEIDEKVYMILEISDFSSVKETHFIHRKCGYIISIQFFKNENLSVYIWMKKKENNDIYKQKTIKGLKLNLEQGTEIIKTINSYKKEIVLKNIFKKEY
jgi:hypothetical protein